MENSSYSKSNSKLRHYQFVNKHVMADSSGLSTSTLKKYRLEGKLKKDIHWVRINSRLVLYNLLLILDWIQNNISDPDAHYAAIKKYLDIMDSNRSKNK